MTPTALNIAKPFTPETWRVQDHTNRMWVERERSRGWIAASRSPHLAFDSTRVCEQSNPFRDGVDSYLRKHPIEERSAIVT